MKTCRRCRETKPLADMKRDARNADGYSSFCKVCHSAASQAWQLANPEKVNAARRVRYSRTKAALNATRRAGYSYERIRWDRLQRLYKVSKEWYEATMEKQHHVCAICGCHPSEFARAFAVDHSHECCAKTPTCGKCNRGLLCHRCNTALHAVERDRKWVDLALNYLESKS